MMNYMNPLLEGLGVSLGIIAGTFVTVLVGFCVQRRKEAQQTRNLRFELELNVKKIKAWLEETGQYRNAVNGDSLHNYAGYFDLSRAVFVTANAMFQSGLLYKKLDYDEIGELQTIAAELSLAGEQVLANQVTEARKLAVQCQLEKTMGVWTANHKPAAVANVDFWGKKFKAHKLVLERIVESLR